MSLCVHKLFDHEDRLTPSAGNSHLELTYEARFKARLARLVWRLYGPFQWQWISRAYLSRSGLRCLQIGCGLNPIPGWLNTDLLPHKPGVAYLDATRPLPLPDASFDYIYSEHLIEHLDYEDGRKLIFECARVLKRGGKLRIATPDLQFLIDLYANSQLSETQRRYIEFEYRRYMPRYETRQKAVVFNNFMHAWRHRFVYDEDTLRELLRKAHFNRIMRYRVGQSDDTTLRSLEHHGAVISEEFNALETMCFEATRNST